MTMTFTPDQRDALREMVNIGLGQAGNALAQLFERFICLSVPQIALVEASEVPKQLATWIKYSGPVSAVRQAFFQDLRGEAVVIYNNEGAQDLPALLGYSEGTLDLDNPDSRGHQLMLEVGNILIAACLNATAEQLAFQLSFTPPDLLGQGEIEELLHPDKMRWGQALLIEVALGLENSKFACHLLFFAPESAIEAIRTSVDRMLS